MIALLHLSRLCLSCLLFRTVSANCDEVNWLKLSVTAQELFSTDTQVSNVGFRKTGVQDGFADVGINCDSKTCYILHLLHWHRNQSDITGNILYNCTPIEVIDDNDGFRTANVSVVSLTKAADAAKPLEQDETVGCDVLQCEQHLSSGGDDVWLCEMLDGFAITDLAKGRAAQRRLILDKVEENDANDDEFTDQVDIVKFREERWLPKPKFKIGGGKAWIVIGKRSVEPSAPMPGMDDSNMTVVQNTFVTDSRDNTSDTAIASSTTGDTDNGDVNDDISVELKKRPWWKPKPIHFMIPGNAKGHGTGTITIGRKHSQSVLVKSNLRGSEGGDPVEDVAHDGDSGVLTVVVTASRTSSTPLRYNYPLIGAIIGICLLWLFMMALSCYHVFKNSQSIRIRYQRIGGSAGGTAADDEARTEPPLI